jgi:hypothetical protein
MCDAVDALDRLETPMAAAKPLFSVEIPEHGPATVAGIPLPDAMVEQLRASASIDPMLVDDDGIPVRIGKRTSSLSPKITAAVLRRIDDLTPEQAKQVGLSRPRARPLNR